MSPPKQPQQPEPEDHGTAEVQKRFDEAHAQGFIGEAPDPTPNENYTVGGVIAGAPTPETDEEAHRAARAATAPPAPGPLTRKDPPDDEQED